MKTLTLGSTFLLLALARTVTAQIVTLDRDPDNALCRAAATEVHADREARSTGPQADRNLEQKEICEQWQFRLLDPKVRIYFDAGRDGDNRIDLFRDGSLAAAVDLAGFVKPFHFTRKGWSTNFSLGIGIGGQGTTSEDGMSIASSAPIVLASAGFLLEVPLGDDDPDNNYVGVEIGRSYGITSDENFGGSSAEDHAWYVGVTLRVPPK